MSLTYVCDYTASGEGQGGVWIHQLSRRHSQAPFKKVKGAVQLVLFHPSKPHFFVAVCALSSDRSHESIAHSTADPTLRSHIQPCGTETAEDAYAGHQVDLIYGRAPIGRSPDCRWLRPQAVLVRPRAQRQAVQNPPVSYARHPVAALPSDISTLCVLVG